MQLLAGTDARTGVRGQGAGGDSAVQPHSMGGVRGGEEGDTQEHTQERTCECCTCPLATCLLKSARFMPAKSSSWPTTQKSGSHVKSLSPSPSYSKEHSKSVSLPHDVMICPV